MSFQPFKAFLPFVPPVPAGGGGGFSPTDIGGLTLWLDASQLTGLSDGNAVSSWTDFSGAGNHAVQATGTKQPLYKTGIIGGLPTVRFDGSNDSLHSPSASLGTIIGVIRTGASIGAFKTWVGARGTTGSPFDAALIGTGTAAATASHRIGLSGGASALGATAASSVAAATNYVWTCRGDYSAGTDLAQWLNGAAKGTAFSGTGPLTSDDTSVGCGWYNNAEVDFMACDIAEIIAYSGALSTGDREAVEDYLGGKYGITVTH